MENVTASAVVCESVAQWSLPGWSSSTQASTVDVRGGRPLRTVSDGMTSETCVRACLRAWHDPAGVEAVRALAVALEGNWESLRTVGEAERVGGLLHRALAPLAIAPPAVTAALRQSRRTTSVRNLVLLHELGLCLQELSAARVAVIALKGAALAQAVYRDLSLRPMGDVDVLVRREDLATTTRLLTALGYTPARAETHPGALAEHENELTFLKRGRFEACIDVHWTLFDSPYYQDRIPMDWFWSTAQPVSIAGVPTMMLGHEALLIHLCGHLALHHGASGLLWWHDIAEVLSTYRDGLDWGELLAKTRMYGLALPVRAVLTRVADEWGVSVPVDVLPALRALPHSRAEERVFAWLTQRDRPAGPRFLADLGSMSGWRRRLRFARTHLFPSASYMRQRYRIRHPLLLPLYYPYRWLRGLRGSR
jgi:Uncharacterised nucleotidyltransferase